MTPNKRDHVNREGMKTSSEAKRQKLTEGSRKRTGFEVSCSSNTIYSSENIKLILKHYLSDKNIEEVYLFKVAGDHVYYNVINQLKAELISEINDERATDDKYYVIVGLHANSDLRVSFAVLLRLCSKNNKKQIQILPAVYNLKNCEQFMLASQLHREPAIRIRVKIDDVPDWFQSNPGADVYISNLIEVMRLSIKYRKPCHVPGGKIEGIMNVPYTACEEIHRELLLNALKVMCVEEIASVVVDNGDEAAPSTPVKKTVLWHPEVRDNEGRTVRRKKRKHKWRNKKKSNID